MFWVTVYREETLPNLTENFYFSLFLILSFFFSFLFLSHCAEFILASSWKGKQPNGDTVLYMIILQECTSIYLFIYCRSKIIMIKRCTWVVV